MVPLARLRAREVRMTMHLAPATTQPWLGLFIVLRSCPWTGQHCCVGILVRVVAGSEPEYTRPLPKAP
jgi:hypothetical protein